MEKQIPKLKKFGKLKQLMMGLAKPLLLIYGLQQLTYLGNTLYHELQPSSQRVAFEKEFGFPLRGYLEDIEGKRISQFAGILSLERNEQPFSLQSFQIESTNPLKQSLIAQVGHTLGNGYHGLFNPLTSTVIITRKGGGETVHHEIKHAKTFEVKRKHSEFLNRWRALAVDSQGKSLYFSMREEFCSKVRGLEHLVDEDKKDSKFNKKLGFVSDYARTNVSEDIAETCAKAEIEASLSLVYPLDLTEVCLGNSKGEEKNTILVAKVQLAQEYGLIPQDFFEYVSLKRCYYSIWEAGMMNQEKVKQFLEKSEEFLGNSSRYEGEVRYGRARLLRDLGGEENIKKAIAEHTHILSLPGLSEDYELSLHYLGEDYALLNDAKSSQIFQKAYKIFTESHERNELFPILSVRSFLEENGILKQK